MAQVPVTVELGFEMAVRITPLTGFGGVGKFFGVRGGTLEMDADEHECGDSESGVDKRFKYGRTLFSLSMDFYEKQGLNVHDDPPGGFQLKTRQFVKVEVYTQGVAFDPYTAPVFGIKNVRFNWTEDGKMEGTLSGKADGQWFRPGEI